MSEKLSVKHEGQEAPNHEIEKHQDKLRHSVERKAEQAKHKHAENIDEIRSKIETEAEGKHEQHDKPPTKRVEKLEAEKPTLINKELKSITYQRTLKRTQSKLSAPSRAFSKFVHHPAVETISEFGSKTIARPSGILLGGISAFVGSTIFLWVSKYYGYEYNFLMFATFFVGGFLVGVLVELGLYLASRKAR